MGEYVSNTTVYDINDEDIDFDAYFDLEETEYDWGWKVYYPIKVGTISQQYMSILVAYLLE